MPNRLAESASPYLRQHADNPVDWYEWGSEAFERARSEDKPVLLSVGYSACHWCHVMAHESFEDPEIAAVMNDLFVSIKVDREERPDIDSIYMEATQAMTGQGGWPMTVWLTPDGRPFYAGTYFPKIDRHGMPAFRRVMEAVSDAWRNRRHEVDAQASRLTEAISRKLPVEPTLREQETLTAAYAQLERHYDQLNGGFGSAPKFPQQPVLDFLLRIHDQPWAPKAGSMLRHTLIRMASGGIRDVVGGGFARYSVDDRWLVPHFEKMLYDNAQLARLYAWGSVELGDPIFSQVALQTFEYMLTDLRHPGGGFFSAEDADSEGVEGKFYVWSTGEIREVLGPDAPLMMDLWGVTPEGNFEGSNILHQALTLTEVAERHGMEPSDVETVAERSRAALLTRRSRRVRPSLDDKVVASWNGLALRAFAEAGGVFSDPRLLEAARECAEFLLTELRPAGRLHRTWVDGALGPPAFLEDHAAVAVGLFALYAATGEIRWFDAAAEITREIPERFKDPDGGFFTTANDAQSLIKRPKDQMDNPAPSGSSLAAEAFTILASYTGDESLRSLAGETIRAAGTVMTTHPTAVGHLLAVLATISRGTQELAIVGPEAPSLASVFWERHRPHAVLATSLEPTDSIPLLVNRGSEGRTLAYVCREFVCAAPVSEAAELRRALGV